MKNNRRQVKSLLLDPVYQLKFVSLVIASSLCLAMANGFVFYYFVRENYTILVDLSPMTDETKLLLYGELHRIALLLGLFSVLFSCIAGFAALWLSHRTAGPLYRFKQVFERIAEGSVRARIHLRPNDEFQGVARAFNSMMDRLHPLNGAVKREPESENTSDEQAA